MMTLVEKTAYRRHVDRFLRCFLTVSEYSVLLWVVSMTVEWGKEEDRFTAAMISRGIGKMVGTGLSERTVQGCLRSLETKGAIFRRRGRDRQTIAVNIEWEGEPMPLVKPKRLSRPEAFADLDRKNLPEPIEEEDTGREDTLCPSDYSEPESQKERLTSRADKVLTDAARSKAALRASKKIDPVSVGRVWLDTFRTTFPGEAVAAWGKKEQGQAKLFVGKLSLRPGDKPLDVVAWVVENWRSILAAKFDWMTKAAPPELPEIGFVLAFADRFVQAYNDRARLREEMTLTGRDHTIRKLVWGGMPREEAERQADEHDAIGRERMGIVEERAKITEALKAIEAREKAKAHQHLTAPRPDFRRAVRANPVRPT